MSIEKENLNEKAVCVTCNQSIATKKWLEKRIQETITKKTHVKLL